MPSPGAPAAAAGAAPAGASPPHPAATTRKALTPLDEALAELLACAVPLARRDVVSTFDADRRVLLDALVSPIAVPAQDNSAMDGYAVRAADLAGASRLDGTGDTSGIRGANNASPPSPVLPVSQRIAAGQAPAPLAAGTAARIFTGAILPAGADAVVMQEQCAEPAPGRVRVDAAPAVGENVRRAGEDIARGATVLAAGTRLTPQALGVAASIGCAQLTVAARPRVALFSTGDELVMPGSVAPGALAPGAVYNSNRFVLRALLERCGCVVTDMGIVPDARAATEAALARAAQAHDLILTSGGVSVGEEDHVRPAVEALGTLRLWRLAIKPGKPFAYGRVGAAHFIGLPGNPVSSFVTFLLLVRPFVLALQGAAQTMPEPLLLPAHFDWPRADPRREFLRVRRNAAGGLERFDHQGSGVLTSVTWGDGLVDTPAGAPIARGDLVRYFPFAELLA